MIKKITRKWRENKAKQAIARQVHGTFRENKAIFIHIPKAAGSSISLSLFGHQVGHWTMLDWYKRDPVAAETFYKFCFVRDPVTRLNSAYNYLRKGGMNAVDRDMGMKLAPNFDQFVDQLLDDQEIANWMHFRPQHEFICSDDMKVLVNFVGKFEDIERDFAKIAATIGSNAVLEKKNIGPENDLNIGSKTTSVIHRIYEADYQTFGY